MLIVQETAAPLVEVTYMKQKAKTVISAVKVTLCRLLIQFQIDVMLLVVSRYTE